MLKANGIHHLAISTANIKQQIEFFSDVLGMELVALYWMHGVDGAWHGFVKANDHCYLAFVEMKSIKQIPIEFGKAHAGSGALPSAPGTMQHLAFNVETTDELLTMRDRIRSNGINVMGPIDHGMCESIYFAGLEGLTLEIATSNAAIDGRAWIDPEVVQLAGISPEELARFRQPVAFEGQHGGVPQPPIDPDKPHLQYPTKVYEAIVAMSDADVTARSSMPEPPVKIEE
jgi:catechol 2,3-dioxygenase-like lactoylglutathione lyase family enzyme